MATTTAPALPPQQPAPIGGAPYPEETADYASPVADGATLTVTLRRVLLAGGSMAGPTAVAQEPEPPDPPDYLDLPLAALPVIQAGTVRGLSAPYEIHRVAPDTRTVVSTSVTNGPALWLWGQLGEWLLCHDEAERIAADLRLRRSIGCRFPISSIFGPERKTWREYFDTLPLDQQDGRAAPAPPSYVPAAPTLLPPESWSPNQAFAS